MSSSQSRGGPATYRADITPPLKWHSPGGKQYQAKHIISLMPPRCKKPNDPDASDPGWLHYVEPYFGGGAVLLENDPEGISEVANDINGELTNFWNVLRDVYAFQDFHRACEATPINEAIYHAPDVVFSGSPRVHAAWKFFVKCRQSLSGRMKGFCGITKNRTRRGMNEQVSAWLSAVEGLPEVHERMKRVLILNRDALEVIRSQDGPRTLFYIDPPYLHETRVTTSDYEYEMSEDEHYKLLGQLTMIKGRFLLSGYSSAIYNNYAEDNRWRRADLEIANHASGSKEKRRMTECVWMND